MAPSTHSRPRFARRSVAAIAVAACAFAFGAIAAADFRLDLKSPSLTGKGHVEFAFPISVSFYPQSEVARLATVDHVVFGPVGPPTIIPTGQPFVALVIAHGPGEVKAVTCDVSGQGVVRMDVAGTTGGGPLDVKPAPITNGKISFVVAPATQVGNRAIKIYGIHTGRPAVWQFTGCTITPQIVAQPPAHP